MSDEDKNVSRRGFLKFAGAAGIGSIIGSKAFGEPNEVSEKKEQVTQSLELPKRKLGKTGVEIPCLALGVAFNAVDNQIILRKAVDWGVTTWDSSPVYENGNGELGIGKYFEKNPEARKKLFLVTKASGAKNIEDIERHLQASMGRMKTDYVDLYYGVHGMSSPSQLNDAIRKWVEKAKERKVIRYFGFSTHTNVNACLMAASKLDWIDAVMPIYNFRVMQDQQFIDAVQACCDAGIGIIAMKTQAQKVESDSDKKLMEHFSAKGFTDGQAKLKYVLDDKRVTAACVGRGDLTHFRQNVAAVLDKKELTQLDNEVLKKYAAESGCGYCAGCAHICESVAADVPVRDVMRYLMYYNSFGDTQTARQLFAEIPQEIRDKMLTVDYSAAESRCPQRLEIARLMSQAMQTLA